MWDKTLKYFKSHQWIELKFSLKKKLFYSWWSPIQNFFAWIVKSIQYSRVLWNDGDWDHIHILILLKYKLSRTRKHIVEHSFIQQAEEVGKEIQDVEDIINRLLTNKYYSEGFDAHEIKWGETKMYTAPSKDYPGCHTIEITTEKAKKEGKVEEEREDFKKLIEETDILEEQDWNLLFDLMKQNMRGWWD
jgi:hypothetical protein